MPEPTLEYRIWQRGTEWHWQVKAGSNDVLASGVAKSSIAARTAAFTYCLQNPGDHTSFK